MDRLRFFYWLRGGNVLETEVSLCLVKVLEGRSSYQVGVRSTVVKLDIKSSHRRTRRTVGIRKRRRGAL
jgi:hypothetical protein